MKSQTSSKPVSKASSYVCTANSGSNCSSVATSVPTVFYGSETSKMAGCTKKPLFPRCTVP